MSSTQQRTDVQISNRRKAASKYLLISQVFYLTKEEIDPPKGKPVTEQGLRTLVRAHFYQEQRGGRHHKELGPGPIPQFRQKGRGGGPLHLQCLGGRFHRHPRPVTPCRRPTAPSLPPPEPGPKQNAHLAGRVGKNPTQRVGP